MISAGALQREVIFVEADHTPGNAFDDLLDAAYRTKYGRGSAAVARITSTEARRTTLRLDPA